MTIPQCARCGDIDVPGHVCADVLAWIAAAPALTTIGQTCGHCGALNCAGHVVIASVSLPSGVKQASAPKEETQDEPPSGWRDRPGML